MEAGKKLSHIRWNRKFLNDLPLVVSRLMPVLSDTEGCLWTVCQPEVGDVKAFFTRVCEQLLVVES